MKHGPGFVSISPDISSNKNITCVQELKCKDSYRQNLNKSRQLLRIEQKVHIMCLENTTICM